MWYFLEVTLLIGRCVLIPISHSTHFFFAGKAIELWNKDSSGNLFVAVGDAHCSARDKEV